MDYKPYGWIDDDQDKHVLDYQQLEEERKQREAEARVPKPSSGKEFPGFDKVTF